MKNDRLFKEWKQSTSVNINGVITDPQEAKISVFDRGFLYGDSIYEVTYTQNSIVMFLNEHIDRLFNSARILDMTISLSREEIIKEILKTLKLSKIPNAYVRIILTRGETEFSLDPHCAFKNNFVIIVAPKKIHSPELYQLGINLFIPDVLRNDMKAVNPNAKSGNYLNNVMAMSEAKKYGAQDALMVNSKSEITEGTTFNVWMIKDKTLYTPPVSSGLLEGITRSKVIDICHEQKLNLKIKTIYQDEILNADEVFITSSTRGIMPVSQINQTRFGDDISNWTYTKKIIQLYKSKISAEASIGQYTYL